jgi:hypothetical protein
LQKTHNRLQTTTINEQAHIVALAIRTDVEPNGAIAHWRYILAAHPRDAPEFSLAHFTDFWLGRPDRMLLTVRAVEPT